MKSIKKQTPPNLPLSGEEIKGSLPLIRGIKEVCGFTLVELIVVITIIAILWTLAFTQMGSFQKDARDSKRITNISTIAAGFDINMAAGKLINTSETSTGYNIVITGSTFTMTGYYWQINNKLLDSLKIYSKDITTTTDYPYSYSYFPTERKYQVSSFLENSSNLPTAMNFIDQVYAETSTGYVYIKGNFSATGGINSLIPSTTAWTNATGTPKVIAGSDTVVPGTSASAPPPPVVCEEGYMLDGWICVAIPSVPVVNPASNITNTSITWNWQTSSNTDYYNFLSGETVIYSWSNLTYTESIVTCGIIYTRTIKACNATTCSTTANFSTPHACLFTYTGNQQTWNVPIGVSSIIADISGASWANGGYGWRVQATLTVTPSETLYLYVWGGGAWAVSYAPGWYNGGWIGWGEWWGAGGGASDIRRSGIALTNRIIVAGWGGWCGSGAAPLNCGGGQGGYVVGNNGGTWNGGTWGTWGTQTAWGTGGGNGSAGALGTGGSGGVPTGYAGWGWAWGWYYGGWGGGGTAAANTAGWGGWGGSSWTNGTNVTYTTWYKYGHGQIMIIY